MKKKNILLLDFIENDMHLFGLYLYPFYSLKDDIKTSLKKIIRTSYLEEERFIEKADNLFIKETLNTSDTNLEGFAFIETENFNKLIPEILSLISPNKYKSRVYYIIVYSNLNKLNDYISTYLNDKNIINITRITENNTLTKINITYNHNNKKVVLTIFTLFYSSTFNLFTLSKDFYTNRKEILYLNLKHINNNDYEYINYDIIIGRLIKNFEETLLNTLQLFFTLLKRAKISPFASLNKLSLIYWQKYDSKKAISVYDNPKLKKFIISILKNPIIFFRDTINFDNYSGLFNYDCFLYNTIYLTKRLIFPKNITKGTWLSFSSLEDYKNQMASGNSSLVGFIKIKLKYNANIDRGSSFLDLQNGRILKTETNNTYITIVGVFSSIEIDYALTLNMYTILPLSGYIGKGHNFLGRFFIKRFYKLFVEEKYFIKKNVINHAADSEIKATINKEIDPLNKPQVGYNFIEIFRSKIGTAFISEIWQNLDNSFNNSVTSKQFYQHYSVFLHAHMRIYLYKLFITNPSILKIDKATILSSTPLPTSKLYDKNRSLLQNMGRYRIKKV
jgi:hypothetical protein